MRRDFFLQKKVEHGVEDSTGISIDSFHDIFPSGDFGADILPRGRDQMIGFIMAPRMRRMHPPYDRTYTYTPVVVPGHADYVRRMITSVTGGDEDATILPPVQERLGNPLRDVMQ